MLEPDDAATQSLARSGQLIKLIGANLNRVFIKNTFSPTYFVSLRERAILTVIETSVTSGHSNACHPLKCKLFTATEGKYLAT